MQILHVITSLWKAAGTSVFCGELANELANRGAQVTVAVVNPQERDRYPLNISIKIAAITDVLRLPGDYDVVHIHALWTPILHRVSVRAHRNGIPVVWSPHGMLAPWAMAHKRWKKILPWYLYQRDDLRRASVLHVTSEMEAGWIRNLGFKQSPVVVPLGTRLSSQVPPRHHKLKTILFVGRIYPVKGLDRLITAWSLLSPDVRRGWQVKLVGPDQAGHMETLKKLTDHLGVSQDIVFTGSLYGEQLTVAYCEADLFVLPSFTENFGGVVVDAMSYGLPVIASKATPWQIIEKVQAGFWVSNEPQPLAAALKQAMALTDVERTSMGANGRQLVEREYTWPEIAEKMRAAYERIVSGK